MIVDDSKVVRSFLKHLVEKQGYRTDEAHDGREALSCMQQRFYDIVFLDLEMPVMGGLDCATAMRTWEQSVGRCHHQRICAVSSHTDTKEKRAVSAGFDHYETKPIHITNLVSLLDT